MGSERAFRHRSYRNVRAKRELLVIDHFHEIHKFLRIFLSWQNIPGTQPDAKCDFHERYPLLNPYPRA